MENKNEKLTYMILGTGGTGGAIGGFLAHAGYDVTFIARGAKLKAMRENGLKIQMPDSDFVINPVQACTSDEFTSLVRSGACEKPDVIFVCVKSYSLPEITPMLAEAADEHTIVIPILNVFGTGSSLQQELPGTTVLDGCIYIWGSHNEPGRIDIGGNIFKVVFGLRRDQKHLEEKLGPTLEQIKDDLAASGIKIILSDNIERDALLKFSYVSPQAACGLYYNMSVDQVKVGEARESFIRLVREVSSLADAMGLSFEKDIVPGHLKTVETANPGTTTSMQRDIAAGGPSEIDGLIYRVVEWADTYGVAAPEYRKIAAEMKRRSLK